MDGGVARHFKGKLLHYDPEGKREEMRSKSIAMSPDYLVNRLSTAMYSGTHLCTAVYVIITHRPLYSSTVSCENCFRENK